MDEMFTTMMPLESAPAVYSTVYAGGSDPLAGLQGQSFFDLLLAQLGMMPQASSQGEGLASFSQFPLMSTMGEEQAALLNEYSEEMTAEGMVPFVEFPLSMESVLPELMPVTDGEVPLAENGGNSANTFFASTSQAMPSTEIMQQMTLPLSETAYSSIRFPIPETASTEGALDMQQVEMPVSLPEQGEPKVLQLFKLFSPDNVASMMSPSTEGAEQSEAADLPEMDSVDPLVLMHQEEPVVEDTVLFSDQEYFMLEPENPWYETMLQTKPQYSSQASHVKSTATQAASSLFETLMPPQTLEQPVPRASGVDSSSTSFSQYHESSKENGFGQYFTAPGSEESTEEAAQTGSREVKHESSFEGRMRQAQEAQSIASQMIKSAQFKSNGQTSEFTVSLKPEYLGNMKVNISMENETLFARIATDSAYTRDVLVHNVDVLKQSLETAGIHLEDIQISFDPADQEGTFAFDRESNAQTKEQLVKENRAQFTGFEMTDIADAFHEAEEEQKTESSINVLI